MWKDKKRNGARRNNNTRRSREILKTNTGGNRQGVKELRSSMIQ